MGWSGIINILLFDMKRLGMPINRDGLTVDHLGLRAGKEQREVGDFVGFDKAFNGLSADHLLRHLFKRNATQHSFAFNHLVDALATHRAGADGVAGDVVGPEFDGEGFGQADNGPFGGGIGRAVAETEEASC